MELEAIQAEAERTEEINRKEQQRRRPMPVPTWVLGVLTVLAGNAWIQSQL